METPTLSQEAQWVSCAQYLRVPIRSKYEERGRSVHPAPPDPSAKIISIRDLWCFGKQLDDISSKPHSNNSVIRDVPSKPPQLSVGLRGAGLSRCWQYERPAFEPPPPTVPPKNLPLPKHFHLSTPQAVVNGLLPYWEDLTSLNITLHAEAGPDTFPLVSLRDVCGNTVLIPYSRYSWNPPLPNSRLRPTRPERDLLGVDYILNPEVPHGLDTWYVYDANMKPVYTPTRHIDYYSYQEHDQCRRKPLKNTRTLCRGGFIIREGAEVSLSYWEQFADCRMARLRNGRLMAVNTGRIVFTSGFMETPVIVIDEAPTWFVGAELLRIEDIPG